ncbi:hypothetical protein [Novosphingobium beihaiensis]|uniref:Uncharacterized protein n=1 Tax=Novosphingobium beihaiensis TaxID=2930389 RepID=A0ABT0BU78_9SPHN|nr:hypothetical protein [Novosphingobium beihaiensis]MCJ2188620.1 hypothetical protein [Novosphingobium beihaiensis]
MKDQFANPFHSRAADLRRLKPALIADVQLYETADGGKKMAALPGWGCPCVTTKDEPISGYDGWPILDEPLEPGEMRASVPFVFLTPEGADLMRKAGRFYLWEGRFVGEAILAAE